MASCNNDSDGEEAQTRCIRSGPSQICSFVRFINTTQRSIDIIWLNYEGIGVVYRTLQPRQYVHVNTFVGHPWIFRDSVTGDRMCVQTQDVYEPVSHISESGRARRRLVYITNPLYSLRERCLQEVRRRVPPSRIEQLELPREILQDLLIRQPDVPILSSTMANQDRSSVRPSSLSMPGLASGYSLASGSSVSRGTSMPSQSSVSGSCLQHGSATSTSGSSLPSRFDGPSNVASVSGTYNNVCTSSRSTAGPGSASQSLSGTTAGQDREGLSSAELVDGCQLINNNNNNDQAMDWNCNNNSSSAVNQNIRPMSEVSSSQSAASPYESSELPNDLSTVSSSSHRPVTSLRNRLLYQYLECQNGRDVVSSCVTADGSWSGGSASTHHNGSEQDGSSDVTMSCSCRANSQNVVDSSSSLRAVNTSRGHSASISSNLGHGIGQSSTGTVTSSSEVELLPAQESRSVSPTTSSQVCQAMDDVSCVNGSGDIVDPTPTSSSMASRLVACRLASSSVDAENGIDSSPAIVGQSHGLCHSNSDPEQLGSQPCSNSSSNSTQDANCMVEDCLAQSHDTQFCDATSGQADVNSTSDEGGKHSLSRIDELRLPFKKHKP